MHSAGQIGDLAVTKDPAAWRGVFEAALSRRYNNLGPICADSWSIPLVKRKILSLVKMAAGLGSSIYYLLPPSCTLKRDKWSQSHAWWRVCAKSLSRVWLFATPWTVAHQAPLSMGLSRQEYWSGLPFSPQGDLPDQGPVGLLVAGRFFTVWWGGRRSNAKIGPKTPAADQEYSGNIVWRFFRSWSD